MYRSSLHNRIIFSVLLPIPLRKPVHFSGIMAQGALLHFKMYFPVLDPSLTLKNSLNYYFSLQVNYVINKIKHILYRQNIAMTIFNQFHLRDGDFCDYLHLACVSINNFHFLN